MRHYTNHQYVLYIRHQSACQSLIQNFTCRYIALWHFISRPSVSIWVNPILQINAFNVRYSIHSQLTKNSYCKWNDHVNAFCHENYEIQGKWKEKMILRFEISHYVRKHTRKFVNIERLENIRWKIVCSTLLLGSQFFYLEDVSYEKVSLH